MADDGPGQVDREALVGSGLNHAIPCVTCGYDLQGLPAQHACPECGTPVARSLAGRRLAGADPSWLRGVVRGQSILSIGVSMMGWAILAPVIAGIGTLTLMLVAAPNSGPEAVFSVCILAAMATMVIGAGLALIGCVLVTRRDPRAQLTEESWSSRIQARVGMAGIVMVPIAAIGLRQFLPGAASLIELVATLLCGASAFIGGRELLNWLDSLAQRIPTNELHDRTARMRRVMAWLIPLITLTASVEPAMTMLGPVVAGGRRVATFASCFGLVLFLVALSTMLRISSLLRAYRHEFRECWREAQANDAGSSPRREP